MIADILIKVNWWWILYIPLIAFFWGFFSEMGLDVREFLERRWRIRRLW